MRKHIAFLSVGAAALMLTPMTAAAQDGDAPVIHYLSVTTFELPFGEEGGLARAYMREVFVPVTKLDANVLSFRFGQHIWGSNSAQVTIVAEYATWEAVNSDCDVCDAWVQEQMPEEGTPEREEWDAKARAFFKAYRGHNDELYAVNMNLAK